MVAGQTFSDAVGHYHAGRLEEADRICRAISRRGRDSQALHLSAAIALQQGELTRAEQMARKAIRANPAEANYYNTLGVIMRRQAKMAEARDCYAKVLQLAPENIDAAFNLANVLADLGETGESIRYYQHVMKFKPDYLSAHLNLAYLYRRMGEYDQAERCFRDAIDRLGEMPELLFGLALVLLDRNHCQNALELLLKVIQMRPDYAEAHFYAGNALCSLGHVAAAEGEHRLCITLKPGYAKAWNNLGNDLRDQGRLAEARQAYRQALQLQPDYMRAHSNLLFATLYDMDDAKAVYEEHLNWHNRHAAAMLPTSAPGARNADPERKLRIGYVSPDFKEHSVAYFIEPILAAYDRQGFEVCCFSDVGRPDAVTERLKGYVDQWLDISAYSDDSVAAAIREQGIDILVDLAGHTSRHRLLVFAGKPAPVQVSYLGYPATTGMAAMDYRLIDAITDPDGSENVCSERLLRLPESFLCYAPAATAPAVAPSPCLENGHISFGSFNHLSKVTEAVVGTWSQILLRVPGARLIMKHISLQDPAIRQRYLDLFESHGVAAGRITMLSWSESVGDHLSCYAGVDIALDTFPYNGTTTTCEALWMGVPVVTFAGDAHVSRVGLSLLNNAGLGELVAGDVHEYIDRAISLAADREYLAAMRSGLRQSVAESALCNRQGMAAALGQAFRDIWKQYCSELQQKKFAKN